MGANRRFLREGKNETQISNALQKFILHMHACFEAVLNINAMDKGYLTYPINKGEIWKIRRWKCRC